MLKCAMVSKQKKTKKKHKTVVKIKSESIVKRSITKQLSTEDVEKMFILYVSNPVVQFVANSLHVSRTTVAKYRDKENWDSRRDQIIRDVRKRDDNVAGKALAENLKVVRFAKAILVKKIQSKKAKSTSTYAELDRMIRLEGFLLGQPDSRTETGRFEHLTDDQLNDKLKNISVFREQHESSGEN